MGVTRLWGLQLEGFLQTDKKCRAFCSHSKAQKSLEIKGGGGHQVADKPSVTSVEGNFKQCHAAVCLV